MLRCIMGSCGLKNKYKRGIEAWCTAGSPQRVFQVFFLANILCDYPLVNNESSQNAVLV